MEYAKKITIIVALWNKGIARDRFLAMSKAERDRFALENKIWGRHMQDFAEEVLQEILNSPAPPPGWTEQRQYGLLPGEPDEMVYTPPPPEATAEQSPPAATPILGMRAEFSKRPMESLDGPPPEQSGCQCVCHKPKLGRTKRDCGPCCK